MRIGKYAVSDEQCKFFFTSFSTENSNDEEKSIDSGFSSLETKLGDITDKLKTYNEHDSDVKIVLTNLDLFKRFVSQIRHAIAPIPANLSSSDLMELPRVKARRALVLDRIFIIDQSDASANEKRPLKKIHDAMNDLIKIERKPVGDIEATKGSDTDQKILITTHSVVSALEQSESKLVPQGTVIEARTGGLTGALSALGMIKQPNKEKITLLEEIHEEICKIEDVFTASIIDKVTIT